MATFKWFDGEVPANVKIRQVYGLVFTKDGRMLLRVENKANGKKLDGLVRRRKAERALFLSEDVTTTPKAESELPYEVITTSDLNIREGAGVSFPKIRVAPKGSKLKVWAIETNGDTKWGKNGKEYFCLGYTKKI
jgi:hypothetical protein